MLVSMDRLSKMRGGIAISLSRGRACLGFSALPTSGSIGSTSSWLVLRESGHRGSRRGEEEPDSSSPLPPLLPLRCENHWPLFESEVRDEDPLRVRVSLEAQDETVLERDSIDDVPDEEEEEDMASSGSLGQGFSLSGSAAAVAAANRVFRVTRRSIFLQYRARMTTRLSTSTDTTIPVMMPLASWPPKLLLTLRPPVRLLAIFPLVHDSCWGSVRHYKTSDGQEPWTSRETTSANHSSHLPTVRPFEPTVSCHRIEG
ncbi:hypothetical protein BX600DRAFT_475353 [Xylariales sp. PMI_506]|nr:hypothetical protein BX600DRAFT_475353 [Xylariales sp. PMI_506]